MHASHAPAGPDSAGAAHRPRDLAAAFWRGRRLVAACALLGCALAGGYAAMSPRQYQATAEVLIDGRQSPVTAGQGGGSAAPLEIAEVESQVELIRSAQVLGAALDGLPPRDVAALDEVHPSVLGRLRRAAEGAVAAVLPVRGRDASPPMRADPARDRVEAVRDRLMARRVGPSYAVEITFTAHDPEAAAAVANAVAAAYVRYQVESKSGLWRRASSWMQQRLEDLGAQASSSARTAQEFKAAHGIIDTGRGLVNEQQLQEINTALLEARAKAVEAEARYEEARRVVAAGSGAPIPGVESDTVVNKLRQDAAASRQQMAELEARYGPAHEAVVRTREQLRAAELALFTEAQRLVRTLESDRDVAKARVAGLDAAFGDSVARSGRTSQDRVRANELDRKAETYNSLYAGLLHRYTDAVDQESFPLATSQVIATAAVPRAPSAPRVTLALALGLVVGAGLGTAAVFALDAADGALSAPADVEALGVACYGLLPRVDRGRAFERRRRALCDATLLPDALSADRLRMDLLQHAPASSFAHSLRAVKTHIVLAAADGASRVVGITSTRAGEGKSMIAGNLARLFTQADERTLVVDADLYEPSMSTLLQIADRPGLAELLDGSARFEDAAHSVDERLTVLGAGRADPSRVDTLLGSDRLRQLLDELRPRFDRIIVDLPPVGEVASTRELAPSLDGVVIVATWASTRASALRGTLNGFARDRTKVFGVVLNKSAQRSVSVPSSYARYRERLEADA